MKTLPFEYWQADYKETEMPSPLQRYWVHRCLEMLDPDTSHLYGLGIVNLYDLLKEFSTSPLRINNRPNYRTFFFLLSEISFRLNKEGTLLKELFTLSEIPKSYDDFVKTTEGGLWMARQSYDDDGKKKESAPINDFVTWLTSETKSESGAMLSLAETIESLFIRPKQWLDAHANCLSCLLTQEIGESDLSQLDAITESWFIELISRYGHAPVHLSNVLQETFLTQSSLTFTERLGGLFQHLHKQEHPYVVYLRLQARRELLSLGRIGSVEFLSQIDSGIQVALNNLQQGKISEEEYELVKEFFFEGRLSERLLFAVISVEASNVGSAARKGLQLLEEALIQARFEFERSSFSIDNTLYVVDESENQIQKFTRRQAITQNYFSTGSPARFSNILRRLEYLRTSQSFPVHDLIEHIVSLAMGWHGHAIESQSTEISFMSHWIELEQLFKTMRNHRIIEGDGSEGDLLVKLIANVLTQLDRAEMLRNLWGDLGRCGIFPPKPYLSHASGYAWFTPSFSKRKTVNPEQTYVPYRRWKQQKPDLIIKNRESRKDIKHYRLPTGFVPLCGEQSSVQVEETWLAGPKLGHGWEFPNLRELFMERDPNLESALYLVRHWEQVVGPLSSEKLRQEYTVVHTLQRSQVLAYAELLRFTKSLPDGKYIFNSIYKWIREKHPDQDLDLRGILVLRYPDEIITGLMEYGFDTSTEIVKRTRNMAKMARELEPHRQKLELLNKVAEEIAHNPTTPDGVLMELFRNTTPYPSSLQTLVNEYYLDKLQPILLKQPLLYKRMESVVAQLTTTISDELAESRRKQLSYIWQLDLMRRTRNEMAHNAATAKNMSSLSRQLYQFSKRYITHIIFSVPPIWRVLSDTDLQSILEGKRIK